MLRVEVKLGEIRIPGLYFTPTENQSTLIILPCVPVSCWTSFDVLLTFSAFSSFYNVPFSYMMTARIFLIMKFVYPVHQCIAYTNNCLKEMSDKFF